MTMKPIFVTGEKTLSKWRSSMNRKLQLQLLIGLVALTTTALAQGAPAWAATEQNDFGQVNYSQREVTATGIGAVPANAPNVGAARANAIRAARVVALRNLIEAVKAVRVNSETTVENNMVTSDVIRTRVEANIRGARQVGDVKYLSDSSVEVTMVVPMSGILDVMLPATASPADATADLSTIAVTDPVAAAEPAVAAPPAPGPITGLIIDARGLGLKPSMSPQILAQDGTVLYGPGKYPRSFAVNQGVVGYHKDPLAAASDSRVAGNPVTIKGIGTAGSLSTDVVLASATAQQISALDGFNSAISSCRVMFILD